MNDFNTVDTDRERIIALESVNASLVDTYYKHQKIIIDLAVRLDRAERRIEKLQGGKYAE